MGTILLVFSHLYRELLYALCRVCHWGLASVTALWYYNSTSGKGNVASTSLLHFSFYSWSFKEIYNFPGLILLIILSKKKTFWDSSCFTIGANLRTWKNNDRKHLLSTLMFQELFSVLSICKPFNSYMHPGRWYYCCNHFPAEDTGIKKLNNLPKVTWLVSSKTGIRKQWCG